MNNKLIDEQHLPIAPIDDLEFKDFSHGEKLSSVDYWEGE